MVHVGSAHAAVPLGTLALVVVEYLTWWLNWMDWHAWASDALLALLFLRILWGFLGSETARFSRFLAPLSRTISSHVPSDGIGTRHRDE